MLDESITRFLNVFEKVDREIPFEGIHWILDHAETISDRNIERVKALGGGIAIQHRMAYQGEYFAQRYGFNAANNTPPIKKMLAMDVPVSGGTDGTRVASYNPWVGLYWLVSGKTVGGTPIYSKANKFERMEALRIYSTNAAWFSNKEGTKGSIVPGQLADLAVLSEDYFSIAEERIKHLESVLTIVDGKPVYSTAEFSDLAPPPLPINPDWSPVKYYGGYYKESKIISTASRLSKSQHRSSLNLSSLNIPGSLSQYWNGLACGCCF